MSIPPTSRPPLDPALVVVPQDWQLDVVAVAPSTNALLAERALAGAPAGSIVVADHQSAGRARLERRWQTPPRSAITMSLLVRPEALPGDWPWLPLLTGYAVQAALADRLPDIALKWPNDVLVEERKLCGILVERIETPRGPAAIVGCGINITQTLEELPIALATSLALELPEPPSREEVLTAVLGSLHALQPLLEDVAALRTAYVDVCSTLDREVAVYLPGQEAPRRGVARDVDGRGRLVVEEASGTWSVSAGDVVHVRAVA